MNRSTRANRAVNVSTKVLKGTPVPKAPPRVMGAALTEVEFEPTKGRTVNSSKERAAGVTPGGMARKPWKGCGDPLGRKRD